MSRNMAKWQNLRLMENICTSLLFAGWFMMDLGSILTLGRGHISTVLTCTQLCRSQPVASSTATTTAHNFKYKLATKFHGNHFPAIDEAQMKSRHRGEAVT